MKEIHVEVGKWGFFHEKSEAFNAGRLNPCIKASLQAG
jgi:hypothetical protein